jgi:Resolvase, N terminal domain
MRATSSTEPALASIRPELTLYRDNGVSGAKSRAERPAFDALCKDAARRRFDMVMAWSVDRLGRSLQDLVAFLSDLHALGIDLSLHQQGVDTRTPAGKALFQMMGVSLAAACSIAGRQPGPRMARSRTTNRGPSHIQRSPLASGSRSYPMEPRGMMGAIASKAAVIEMRQVAPRNRAV